MSMSEARASPCLGEWGTSGSSEVTGDDAGGVG